MILIRELFLVEKKSQYRESRWNCTSMAVECVLVVKTHL